MAKWSVLTFSFIWHGSWWKQIWHINVDGIYEWVQFDADLNKNLILADLNIFHFILDRLHSVKGQCSAPEVCAPLSATLVCHFGMAGMSNSQRFDWMLRCTMGVVVNFSLEGFSYTDLNILSKKMWHDCSPFAPMTPWVVIHVMMSLV